MGSLPSFFLCLPAILLLQCTNEKWGTLASVEEKPENTPKKWNNVKLRAPSRIDDRPKPFGLPLIKFLFEIHNSDRVNLIGWSGSFILISYWLHLVSFVLSIRSRPRAPWSFEDGGGQRRPEGLWVSACEMETPHILLSPSSSHPHPAVATKKKLFFFRRVLSIGSLHSPHLSPT